MKVLVLGQGAREHALAWKIGVSPECEAVFCWPGNAGLFRDPILRLNVELTATVDELAKCARAEGIDLIIIGPETYLAQGFADELRKRHFHVFGPGSESARLESSKVFAKQFMEEFTIPTARFLVVESEKELQAQAAPPFPKVLKFDGLAAGKGVVVAQSVEEMRDFGRTVFQTQVFGSKPLVVVEEHISGFELSYIGLCDGERFLPLETATDYKRVRNGDLGPNTGGMGAVSPSPFLTKELETQIQHQIIKPTLAGLRHRGLIYRGALFLGIMVDEFGNPKLLEYNARFGDPETQAVLLRLKSDLLPLLDATARGLLSRIEKIDWNSDPSVYVVACAENYPGAPIIGDEIFGLERTPNGVKVFSSAIELKSSKGWQTGGGRVLGVGATASSVSKARETVYQTMAAITWRGQHFRTDIAEKNR